MGFWVGVEGLGMGRTKNKFMQYWCFLEVLRDIEILHFFPCLAGPQTGLHGNKANMDKEYTICWKVNLIMNFIPTYSVRLRGHWSSHGNQNHLVMSYIAFESGSGSFTSSELQYWKQEAENMIFGNPQVTVFLNTSWEQL